MNNITETGDSRIAKIEDQLNQYKTFADCMGNWEGWNKYLDLIEEMRELKVDIM